MIPEDVIQRVREAMPLNELIGRYVKLTRSGKSWKGCCPFHQENRPSFHVWPVTGTWKCFGCGKGGNAFKFLMEREGLTFPDAVHKLAQEVGVTIPDTR